MAETYAPRVNASVIQPGDTVVGVGTVESVRTFDDPRWSVRVTWDDGSSTLYSHHARVQIEGMN